MAIPPLIAEGFAKKHPKRAFQKYLYDAIGEANETIVHLNYCKDLYKNTLNQESISRLIEEYEKITKQLYRLIRAWDKFK